MLPLSKAPLTAVGIITLVYVWSEAQIGIILLQHPQNQTIAVGVLGFVSQFEASLVPCLRASAWQLCLCSSST